MLISAYMPKEKKMKYEDIFKILSDTTRLRLYKLLATTGLEAAVCELMDSLQCTHYNVSKHLRLLHLAGLLKERKDGRWVFYSDVGLKDMFIIGLKKAIKNIKDPVYEQDLKRLKKRIALRKGGKIQFCMKEIKKKGGVS